MLEPWVADSGLRVKTTFDGTSATIGTMYQVPKVVFVFEIKEGEGRSCVKWASDESAKYARGKSRAT